MIVRAQVLRGGGESSVDDGSVVAVEDVLVDEMGRGNPCVSVDGEDVVVAQIGYSQAAIERGPHGMDMMDDVEARGCIRRSRCNNRGRTGVETHLQSGKEGR